MDTKKKTSATGFAGKVVLDAKRNADVAHVLGKFVSFNSSLKLYHWHITGKGSYAQHIALDQAIGPLTDAVDRLSETAYAMYGDLEIVVPETRNPKNIIKHAEDFYNELTEGRDFFPEAFTQSILDDCQEAIQQLLYRLKRLE